VSHRKEQKEALRREREERERKAKEAQQRKRLVGVGAAGALALAAVVVIVVLLAGGGGGSESKASEDVLPGGGSVPEQQVTDLQEATRAAGCELSSERATTREHLGNVDARVKYRTNPPTDGRHYQNPADDGAYSEAPPDTTLVHTLEHGRVIVWFKPSLPEEQRADLKALFDEDEYQMVLVPRRNMDYDVAASAWNADPVPNGTGRLMTCKSFSPGVFDAIRTFRDEHRSNGPEPVP
jgi:hypothetical protein